MTEDTHRSYTLHVHTPVGVRYLISFEGTRAEEALDSYRKILSSPDGVAYFYSALPLGPTELQTEILALVQGREPQVVTECGFQPGTATWYVTEHPVTPIP